jgi:hypothetical protein
MFFVVVMIGEATVVVVSGVATVVVMTGVATVVVMTGVATVVVMTGEATVVVVSGGAAVVVVGVGGVVVTGGAQVGAVMVFVSRVTAPFMANRRPSTVAAVVAVMSVRANRFPRNTELVPRVAELPTCQNTLHACVPLINATVLEEEVINVDPAWKTKTALGSPCASSVTVPESAIDSPEL